MIFVYHGEENGVVPEADSVIVPEGTTRIVIADSVTYVPWLSLNTFTFSSVTTIRLHPGIDYICEGAFSRLPYLTRIENLSILDRITTIPTQCFQGCEFLTTIDLGGSVMLTSIDEAAFFECHALRSIRLPDSVREIGKHAFRNCTALEEFTIPSKVTVIEEAFFFGCKSLQHIHIPASVAKFGVEAFALTALRSMSFAPVDECTLEYLDSDFMSGCNGLETFRLPPSVTNAPFDAFNHFPNRILLPWGKFENGPFQCLPQRRHKHAFPVPVLTMAFILLQRAGRSCGIPVHRMHKCADAYTPTSAELVDLLSALMASPEFDGFSNSSEYQQPIVVPVETHQRIMTQAIFLILKTFSADLFGNGEGPLGINNSTITP
jgi:BspA type Leucine rich repeat region (6 copies)